MSQLLPTARSDGTATAPAATSDPAEPVAAVATPAVPGARTAVVGLGYVGLPTSLALISSGSRVIGVDIDPTRLDDIRAGRADLLDVDRDRLRETLQAVDPAFRLTTSVSDIADADTVLICVPTPVDRHLAPDLTALRAACAAVVAHARPGQTIVLTSTSYVGTTRDLLVEPLAARGLQVGHEVWVAFAPERVDPGNDRHRQELTPRVVGGTTPDCTARAAAALARIAPRVHQLGSPEAAEMTKLLENTFRAVNIALANEFADLCRELHLDVTEVIDGADTKPYGFMAFQPGPGVGGHCIPCDPHYLLWQLRGQRREAPLIETAMRGIAARPGRVVERIRDLLAGVGRTLLGARILLVGVTYKPGVADVRESPALEIIGELIRAGAGVDFVDDLVASVRTSDGGTLHRIADHTAREWDLVVVHTTQAGLDESWLRAQPMVLDATYRLTGLPRREVL
ncbi:nucleotide sugar dehydrogenase [Micromonospora endophytica]|uniref:Nucleotide sugar dehydrogenase n=1 Tax=Micromonospora endophytica TaxID=515350 RepID=A0A2W2DJ57_9ACTN|nr:nucleotide sugar dehydrogenase [Micromonospora endophytica]PZF97246.1 nucleotide sugar dehydrogenase [Micromonospora endophytica]RIW51430.1 nucleotide sugar dehydrogenase [Micromonospora endophytica]BCJ62146.1 nucleotide sugar dehydrogenase [Micromonospora endophytica]